MRPETVPDAVERGVRGKFFQEHRCSIGEAASVL